MSVFLVFVVAAFAVVGGTPFELECQPPTRWIRLSLAQDVSPDMTPFIQVLQGGVLTELDNWITAFFDWGAVSSVGYFTDKAFVTGSGDDTCWTMHKSFLSPSSSLPSKSDFPTDVGSNPEERSVLDALYNAANQDWEAPQQAGRRLLFIATNKMPRMPPSGLPVFSPGADCSSVDYPSVNDVVAKLLSIDIYVVFIVPHSLVSSYEGMFSALGSHSVVVPLALSSMSDVLNAAINKVYCGIELPTFPPTMTTTAPVVTIGPGDITGPIIITNQPPPTQAPTCASSTILQLLHLQDFSWSYTNDMTHMKAKMPSLLEDLQQLFYRAEIALSTFVDKPIANTGYVGDYCYREDLNFTTDGSVYESTLGAIKIKSGRDWAESQYDAIKGGVLSEQLGWQSGTLSGDKYLLRVVILITDAGPHVSGDHPGLPKGDINTFDCNANDYPAPADIQSLLTDKAVYPMAVVTSDIYGYWTSLMTQLSSVGKVIRLADPIDDIVFAIEKALEEICVATRL